MRSWNIAIVGATGQVGTALADLLQSESSLTFEQIYFLDEEDNAGETVRFLGKNQTIISTSEFDWSSCELAFFVTHHNVAKQYAPIAANHGCIVIDSSDAFVDNSNIALIVPKINNEVLTNYRDENIITVASPVVCQALRTIASLTELSLLSQLNITNLVPASFYGKSGVDELASQSARLLNGLPVENELFSQQLAFNLLPILSSQSDTPFSLHESSIIEQIKRITQNYQLSISVDSVLVPVFYGMTQSICMSSSAPLYIENKLVELGADFDIELFETTIPTPVSTIHLQQEMSKPIKLTNLRYSQDNQEQVQFIAISDNIRYLGAQMLLEAAMALDNYFIK